MLGRGMSDTYTVFLLPLQHEFGWSRSELTGVYSLYLLVSGFTCPLVGHVFDRLGPRWVYGAGLALLGTAFVLSASLSDLWQFYLLIGVAVGVGAALTGMVPASGLLARWYRARLSTAIGVVFSAVGAGAITLVPLAQWLEEHYDWRTAYRVLGALLELAGEKAQAVKLAAEPPLDESWAEPPVFGGCSTQGQAKPGQPQPIHIIRKSAHTGVAT